MDDGIREAQQHTARRLPREDGSLGPPLRKPWRQWDILARADIFATALTTTGIFLTALSVFEPGTETGALPTLYSTIAPLAGVGYFVALITQFLERERHGIARGILVGCAVVLASSGVALASKVAPELILLTYWVPALLGLGAAIVLLRGHRRADAFVEQVRHS